MLESTAALGAAMATSVMSCDWMLATDGDRDFCRTFGVDAGEELAEVRGDFTTDSMRRRATGFRKET